ncbi:MAG TPA: hypothetical protein VK747_21560, partial [Blastocatellia bacterium]|nr:hypothetical protein [Blastocatellia bacterium]
TGATSPNLGQYFKLAGPKAQGSQKVTTAGERPAASEFHKTHQYSVQVGSTTGAGPRKAAGAGAQKTKGPQQIATQRGQAAEGHYIGIDHTLVNKSNVAKPPGAGTGKATTVGKPTTATERELMDLMSESRRNNSRAGMGKATTVDKSDSFATTPSPHRSIGRNDGRVQQLTTAGGSAVRQPPSVTQKSAGGRSAESRGGDLPINVHDKKRASQPYPQKTKKSKVSRTSAAGSSPAVQLHKFSNTTFKPQRQVAGKPAKASKNNDQRPTQEYHKVWEDGKLPSGGTGVDKPTANAVTGKPTTGQRATTNYGSNYSSNYGGNYGSNDPHVQKTKRSQQATAHHASGSYSARVGSTAGGKKKGEKVSRTSNPR